MGKVKGELLFLGTGGSTGIPVIACQCAVCTSTAQHNKRLRPSVLVKVQGKSFLIDVGPDFRTQALTYKIDQLDGVLLTHTHYDHLGGLDDLRSYFFAQKKRMPCLLSRESFQEIKIRYHYLMRPLKDGHTICAQLDFFELEKDFGEVLFEGVNWKYMSYFQSSTEVTGYRLGSMAYISDIREYSDQLLKSLEGVELLVVSAQRYVPSSLHFSLDEAVDFSQKVGASRTWITHITHDLDHNEANQKLPHNVRLSYDGLQVPFFI